MTEWNFGKEKEPSLGNMFLMRNNVALLITMKVWRIFGYLPAPTAHLDLLHCHIQQSSFCSAKEEEEEDQVT